MHRYRCNMGKRIGTGTLVDLHGYFRLWFPFDRPGPVARALAANPGPRIVLEEEGHIEVLNMNGARVWSLHELDHWPDPDRGHLLLMYLDPHDEAEDPQVAQWPDEALPAVRKWAKTHLGQQIDEPPAQATDETQGNE